MPLPVIKAENLSKNFVIAHEAPERYQSLRDVIAKKAGNLLGQGKKKSTTKEEFFALKDVSFDIHAGDRVGIIGRNGAGKSTLLKLLSRIMEPSSGRITMRGRVASLLEVGTGFHPELTGRENIFLNGAILGMSRNEIRRKFDEIVDFAEVEKFLDTPVKRYSSGMYVRLAFAVAAHLEPEILIVDEVLAVGDAQFQKKCLGKMEDVSKNEGRTVLFVSHNMGVIAQLCQKAILLKQGQVVSYDSAFNVINSYIAMDQAGTNVYLPSDDTARRKENFFTRIASENEKGEGATDYSFDDGIVLDFRFSLKVRTSNLQIGIGINDKLQNRIFTVLKPIDFFRQNGSNEYVGKVKLPARIIAPNIYSFACAIWTREGHVYDYVDNVCPVKIHDNGTNLALYEGIDYGSVIVDAEWFS
ncbi:MAG: ABC transporter ATP-binding protein [Bacteroidetes bacterium]|nr:ABC transporter ATP-binding protein [Bacteroidota bacterium]